MSSNNMNGGKAINKPALDVKTMALVAIMAAVCCVLGPIAVPIGPIPVSLSLIAIYLSAYALGAKKGTLAVLIYILLGAVGLPVFSGAEGGIAKLIGPTGGYIIGFIFTCFISGWFIEHFQVKQFYFQIAGMLLGLVICYIFGTAWFMLVTANDLGKSLTLCIYPFIPFDIAKIVICVLLGNAIRKGIKSAGF